MDAPTAAFRWDRSYKHVRVRNSNGIGSGRWNRRLPSHGPLLVQLILDELVGCPVLPLDAARVCGEQDLDAVPGARRDLGVAQTRVEPDRYPGMPQ